MSEEEGEETKEISKFAAMALRAPRKSTFDMILTQHLILSISAKPLKKIALVSQAAMMCKPDKIKNQEELTRIYRCARAFQSASYQKIDQFGTRMFYVPWDFPSTEQNFNDFVKPWYRSVPYFSDHIKYHRRPIWQLRHRRGFNVRCDYVLATIEKEDEIGKTKKEIVAQYEICPDCNSELRERDIDADRTVIVSENPVWSFFFEVSAKCLSEAGFKMLRNSFISWAMPLIQKAVAELSELVTPQQYSEMLQLLTKKGEEKAESSLGPRE